MRKTSVYLTTDEAEGLRDLAVREGRPQAQLIREGIRRVIADAGGRPRMFHSRGVGHYGGPKPSRWTSDELYDEVMAKRGFALSDLVVRPDDLAIVAIDVQPVFLDVMAGPTEPVLARLELLFGLASAFDLPVLATFEKPDSNGWLPPRLEPFFPAGGQRHVKQTFNCCAEPTILEAMEGLNRRQIAVAGAETDVCLLQSVLGLIAAGKQVFLLEDAVFSSETNVGPAIRRMEAAGAVPSTVKTLYYELRHSVAAPRPTDVFRQRTSGLTILEPESLPPIG